MKPSALGPRHKFNVQRNDARRRGIVWDLTFEQWLIIWLESGHWLQRGAKAGCYVMARNGDAGPYAVNNVRITTCEQNHSESPHNIHKLPLGVTPNGSGFTSKRSINGKETYLGSFKTPEEAHSAYLAAAPTTGAAA